MGCGVERESSSRGDPKEGLCPCPASPAPYGSVEPPGVTGCIPLWGLVAADLTMASEKKATKPDVLKAKEEQQASAVDRVTSLPLLSSAFSLVSSAYNHGKETHPCLGSACSVAETVAAVAVGSVVGGAQPNLNQLEPHIALVNEYACKGLDQLEETLPFLQQPADKVISDTKQLVSSKVVSAMDAACGAKEAMADRVTEAVDLTKSVVGDGVKLTRSMVTSTVTSAVEAAQGAKDLVTNKVTEAVDLSKHIVEDSIGLTKSAVASTIVNAVEAAQDAKGLLSNKVMEAVGLTKHIVEDSVGLTKSAVASTIVNAVEAAQGAKDLVTDKVTEAVDLTKHIVEDSVGLTKSAVASTITAAVGAAQGAKELVTNKVTEAVDLTKEAVQDGIEKTKSMVTSTVTTALDAAYGTISSKVQTALEHSREAIQESVEITNLPMTEEELGQLAAAAGSDVASVQEQREQQGYFVRLGALPAAVRPGAYRHSLNKLQHVGRSAQDTLSQLQRAINLIECVKNEVGQKLLDGQEKLYQLWVDWSLTQPKGHQIKTASQAEQVEPRTLAMLRIITQQLQPAYENLKAAIHGLPGTMQAAVHQATQNIQKLHADFSRAKSFQDLSSSTLSQSQDTVREAQRSLEELLEFVTQNVPLNWLVGPFQAQKRCRVMTDLKSPASEQGPSPQEAAQGPEEAKGAERALGVGSEVLEELEKKIEKYTQKMPPSRGLAPSMRFPAPGSALDAEPRSHPAPMPNSTLWGRASALGANHDPGEAESLRPRRLSRCQRILREPLLCCRRPRPPSRHGRLRLTSLRPGASVPLAGSSAQTVPGSEMSP
ncbi:PREDICTED: perilipin-3-like [Tinamus guttatus]|uniref:perilipin-3-like n=1 Tax=Tinamus guttatus TaxID=94827 RepID=UPI00052E9E7A|nr:PREDICTED: perilipin-3-like [Tinamus guttatus]